MKLSDELKSFRSDRPDEWKMDEFIRKAQELESQVDVFVPKCLHEEIAVGYSHNTCKSCGSINTDSQWGAASNKWFDNTAAAKFYQSNGYLPGRD